MIQEIDVSNLSFFKIIWVFKFDKIKLIFLAKTFRPTCMKLQSIFTCNSVMNRVIEV